MKKILALLAAICLLLALAACGKAVSEPAQSGAAPGDRTEAQEPGGEKPRATAAPARSGSYHRVEITAENWEQYFELKEIPLYVVSGEDVIALVYQNYCVELRDEYLPDLKPNGNYRVQFTFRFDLYVDTLDVNTEERLYRHTDDLLYAVQAEKSAVFDKTALPASAYGADHTLYTDYGNAFFIGYAMLHPESRVWSGFYMDLSKVEPVKVSGYLELGG